MKIKPKLSQEEIEAITKEKADKYKAAKEQAAWVKGQLNYIYKDGYKFLDFPYQGATVCYRIVEHNVISFSFSLCNPNDRWNKNEGRYQAWNHMAFGFYTRIKVKNPKTREIRFLFERFLESATGKYKPEDW